MWQEIFFLVHLIYALINSLEYSGGHVSSEAGLTDDRLTVVTSNVVPFNTITVEVVEHPKTVFVALTVVWLWSAEPSSMRPVCVGEAVARGPSPGAGALLVTTRPDELNSMFSEDTRYEVVLVLCFNTNTLEASTKVGAVRVCLIPSVSIGIYTPRKVVVCTESRFVYQTSWSSAGGNLFPSRLNP